MVAGLGSVSADMVQSLSNVVADGTIVIGGGGGGWTGLTGFQTDPNEGATLDWHQVTIANDSTNYYIQYQMNAGTYYPDWQYAIYFDTDLSRSTGFIGGGGQFPIGADFMIQGSNLYSYAPTAGTDWSASTFLSSVTYSYTGGFATIEFSVPISTFGTNTFNFLLLGTGEIAGTYYEDYYVDSANQGATGGYLQYTTVPEPGTSCLAAIGLGAVLLRRRGRRA